MATFEEQVMDRVNKYLSGTRSENTRRVARDIVEFLIEMRKEPVGSNPDVWKFGWTRSSLIFKQMVAEHPRTITRILENLSEDGIIERRDCPRVKGMPGKPPVFYRVPGFYKPHMFDTREELQEKLKDEYKKNVVLAVRLSIAYQICKEKTGEDISDQVKELADKQELDLNKTIMVTQGKMPKEVDPCTTIE